jgi:hypothetical protein
MREPVMAEPNEMSDSGNKVAPDANNELPHVASPSLSPAEPVKEPVLDAQMPSPAEVARPTPDATADEPLRLAPRIPPLRISPIKIPDMKMPGLRVSRRLRRRAALVATVALAAGFGAVVGAVVNRAPASPPPKPDVAMIQENQTLQRSVAKLTKDIATLRTSVETAAREGRTQIARVNEELNKRVARAPETTGSIGKVATTTTTTATPPPAPVIAKPEVAPIPTPRPAIVQGWTVRDGRNGRALVESRGELFEVFPGVPLPGLGRVEAVRHEGGQWVVVTSRGLITSAESSAAVRPRSAYPPYYRPY